MLALRSLETRQLTSFGLLGYRLLLLARQGLLDRLGLEHGAAVSAAAGVERALQRVALPAKDVVAVLAVSGTGRKFSRTFQSKGTQFEGDSRVAHRVDQRLAILGPQLRIVELARVPHDLVHELGQPDRVAGRAGARRLEAAAAGVRDMALVVRAVDVLAVPASVVFSCQTMRTASVPSGTGLIFMISGHPRGEGDGRPDAAGTDAVGERGRVVARAGRAAEGVLLDVVLASVADLPLHASRGAEVRVAD